MTKLIDYEQFCGIRGEEKPANANIGDMTPEELKQRLDAGDKDLFVLDVREPNEYQICNLGGHLIPLNDLPKRVSELDSSREIVVHCKMGGRSAKAVDYLSQSGLHQRAQSRRRNQRLGRAHRSQDAEVLRAAISS